MTCNLNVILGGPSAYPFYKRAYLLLCGAQLTHASGVLQLAGAPAFLQARSYVPWPHGCLFCVCAVPMFAVQVIPDGVLLFLPNYALLNMLTKRWQASRGIWSWVSSPHIECPLAAHAASKMLLAASTPAPARLPPPPSQKGDAHAFALLAAALPCPDPVYLDICRLCLPCSPPACGPSFGRSRKL